MNRLEFKSGNKSIVVDDSLNNHGGVGIDFWRKDGDCYTELFMLNHDETVKLANWFVEYLRTAP